MQCRHCLSLRLLAGALGWCLLALLVVGCGGEETGTITGKVIFQGQPLPEGIVSFVTQKGYVATGRIHEGEYSVKEVPVGPARITVRQIVDSLAKNPKSSLVKEIPLRYRSADDSGLKYTVVGGAQTHDFELTQ
jgi:hypothetical protein